MSSSSKFSSQSEQKRTAAKSPPTKRFTTCSRSSIFTSCISKGPKSGTNSVQSKDFAYDLSKAEQHFMNHNHPMKEVPAGEKELLKTGQRQTYLKLRYGHSPDIKYNYPEATSWRIGWMHNQEPKKP